MNRLNASEWDKHYAAWQSSGKSISTFCKEEGLNYQRLCYWRQIKEGTKKRLQKNKFIKLQSSSPLSEQQFQRPSELVFPNGVRIVFSQLPDVTYLKQLVG